MLRSFISEGYLPWLGSGSVGLGWLVGIFVRSKTGTLHLLASLMIWRLVASVCRIADREERYQRFRDRAFDHWENRLIASLPEDRRNDMGR